MWRVPKDACKDLMGRTFAAAERAIVGKSTTKPQSVNNRHGILAAATMMRARRENYPLPFFMYCKMSK